MMHHKAKISFRIVQEARHQRQRFGKTYSAISIMFGVSQWTIRDWVDYRTRTTR